MPQLQRSNFHSKSCHMSCSSDKKRNNKSLVNCNADATVHLMVAHFTALSTRTSRNHPNQFEPTPPPSNPASFSISKSPPDFLPISPPLELSSFQQISRSIFLLTPSLSSQHHSHHFPRTARHERGFRTHFKLPLPLPSPFPPIPHVHSYSRTRTVEPGKKLAIPCLKTRGYLLANKTSK